MAAPVLQFKRGNLASLPGLQAGEPGFTVDKNDLYVGIDSTTGNNQFIGSGRFWDKGDATNASGVKLVEAQNNGSSAITIKAPAALGDNQVYTMPASAVNNGFLKCNASGEFSFDTAPQNAGGATEITVADESSDTTCFPIFAVSATGSVAPKTGSNLSFNSSSGALTATSFVGDITGDVTGNADTATVATTITLADESTDTACNVVFATAATGNLAPKTGTNLTFNSASGALTATTFVGALTGAVTGNVTGNISGNQSGGTVSATSAAIADLTSGRVVLAGTSGELEDSGNLTFDGSTMTVTGAASVTTNLTVGGNLTVNGTTTQVNTTNTTIEDVLLELQVVDGGALSSDTNKDVGLVLNYYSGSAKKAAVYWDDSAGRIVLGSEVSESAGVLTASAFSGLEIGSLFVNDCAGQTQVISCSGTTRSLENITIDGGSF